MHYYRTLNSTRSKCKIKHKRATNMHSQQFSLRQRRILRRMSLSPQTRSHSMHQTSIFDPTVTFFLTIATPLSLSRIRNPKLKTHCRLRFTGVFLFISLPFFQYSGGTQCLIHYDLGARVGLKLKDWGSWMQLEMYPL